jgi:hypothetical protein
VELYGKVGENLGLDGLASLALVSRNFQVEAERLLYRAIRYISPGFDVSARAPDTENLLNQPRVWEYIRYYKFTMLEYYESTRTVRQSLRLLLPKMTKLTALHIYASQNRSGDLRRWKSCGDLFDGCTFSLRSFSSVFDLDGELALFLGRHPAIRELTWYSNSPASHSLPASMLPNLRSLVFQPDLGPNELLHFIAPGRPITHASGLFETRDLRVLAKCSGPLQCLQMRELNRKQLDEIAQYLPHLEFLTSINLDEEEFQVAYHD